MENVYEPKWNVKYVQTSKKADFVKNHTGVFKGITDKDLEEVWESHQKKSEKPTS